MMDVEILNYEEKSEFAEFYHLFDIVIVYMHKYLRHVSNDFEFDCATRVMFSKSHI